MTRSTSSVPALGMARIGSILLLDPTRAMFHGAPTAAELRQLAKRRSLRVLQCMGAVKSST